MHWFKVNENVCFLACYTHNVIISLNQPGIFFKPQIPNPGWITEIVLEHGSSILRFWK